MTTILKISKGAAGRPSAVNSLRDAGIGVLEVESWEQASDALRNGEASVVVCEDEALAGVDPGAFKQAIGAIGAANRNSLPPDVARTISHELRTPLSAMAGWLHLMESGKLDAEGMKRAITKLRGNIDDQVRLIDRYLGTNTTRS